MLVAGDASRRFDDVAADVDGDVSIIAAVDECNACMRAAWARQAWRLPSTTSYSGAASLSLSLLPFPLLWGWPLVWLRSSYANLLANVSRCFIIKSYPKHRARERERRLSKHSCHPLKGGRCCPTYPNQSEGPGLAWHRHYRPINAQTCSYQL